MTLAPKGHLLCSGRFWSNAVRSLSLCGALLSTVIALALLPSAAQALAIHSFVDTPSTTQAGAHPNLTTEFSTDYFDSPSIPCHCNDPKDFDVSIPAGFIGNPHATPQCTAADFATERCPLDSQVGFASYAADFGNNVILSGGGSPIYNLVPEPSQAGLLGFAIAPLGIPVYQVLTARTGGDYGLNDSVEGVEQWLPLTEYAQELWGVPAESTHNSKRCSYGLHVCGSSNSPLTPFLQNPTTCGASLSSTLHVVGYDGSQSEAIAPWPETTGCDSLSFNPSLSAQPTTTQADSPSGLEVDLSVPQELSPETPSPSEIRDTIVELPEGFTINPSAADGKLACAEDQAHLPFGSFASEAEATCPEYSKIGTVTLASSALPEPLSGSIYLGEPLPNDRYRIVFTANGFATHIKLTGTIVPNPQTGRLTTSFRDLPQSPLTEINLHFFGSERGLLATPTRCGTYAVHSTFVPWDESLSSQEATQFFKIESGPGGTECPGPARPFAPAFHSSTDANLAATHTPFWLELTRPDGDQNLAGLSLTTPPGLLATLKGVSYCPQASIQAAANPAYSGLQEESHPSCPPASQIGTSYAGAGAGDHLVYLPGKVYLAGPYKGAPLSLAVITPAVSGPYDLGNVVLRVALQVNPETTQITAVSDPLPQILEGIPLRLRSILLELNREGFTLTPTNCDPLSVTATASGAEGTQAGLSSPFQVANCANLAFAPKLSMRFTGSTKQAGVPAVHADLSYPKDGPYANVSRAVITLPPTELVDNAHINAPCTKVQFFAGATLGENCPPGSDIGFAKATSPLLEKPLQGPVYLRTGAGHKLPDIVAALNGQIDVALDGHVDQVKGGIRTSFETVPDAPVSNFTLTLDGGTKGLLQNNTNLCAHSLHVKADITGQNGKTANQNPVLSTPCGAKKHKRKGHRATRVHHTRTGR